MTKLGDIFNKRIEKKEFSASEKHWGDLESMLNEHDASKKGGAAWWLGGAGVFAIALLFGWFAIDTSNEIASIDEPTSSNAKISNTNIQKSTTAESSELIQQKDKVSDNTVDGVKNDDKNQESLGKIEEEAIAENPEEVSKTDNNNQAIPPAKISTSNGAADIAEEAIAENPEEELKTNNNNQAIPPAKISTSNEAEDVVEETIAENPEEELKTNNNNQAIPLAKISTSNEAEDVAEKTDNSNEPAGVNQNSNKLIDNSYSAIENTNSEVFDKLELMDLLGISLVENQIDVLNPVEDFIDGGKSKFQLEVGLYSGPMFVGKYLSSATNADYITRRQGEEIDRISFNSNIDLNIKFGKLLLSTGLNNHQQGEVTNYSNDYENWVVTQWIDYEVTDNSFWQLNTTSFTIITDDNYTIDTDTVLSYYDETIGSYVTDTVNYQSYEINNIGTQQFDLVDSIYVVQFDSTATLVVDSSLVLVADANNTQQKTTTRFSYVEVPILLGYEFPINRLSLSCKTGIGVGMLTRYNATYYTQDYSAPQLVNESQVNQLMINYLLRIGMKYAINESIAFSCEPFYRLNLSNVIKSEDVTQKYWNAGLNIGAVYSF
jgi:hypothetical protein